MSAILEAAQHVDDRVHLADVGEELVAEALALARRRAPGRRCRRTRARRDDLRRLADRRRACRAADRAPRPGRCSARWCRTDSWPPAPPRCGQRVEQRRLADVRQADDAAVETHCPVDQSSLHRCADTLDRGHRAALGFGRRCGRAWRYACRGAPAPAAHRPRPRPAAAPGSLFMKHCVILASAACRHRVEHRSSHARSALAKSLSTWPCTAP